MNTVEETKKLAVQTLALISLIEEKPASELMFSSVDIILTIAENSRKLSKIFVIISEESLSLVSYLQENMKKKIEDVLNG